MKRNYILDYIGFFLLKALSFCLHYIPIGLSLFVARRIANLWYWLDRKHRVLVLANLKTAFPEKSPEQLRGIARVFFSNFAQNFIELLYIPRIGKRYIETFITIHGQEYIQQALARGKGVILLGVHEGSWEVTNTLWEYLQFPFVLFVREQGMHFLDTFLNAQRSYSAKTIIRRQGGARQLIEALKNNQVIAMSADQGGKAGIQVQFFNKSASMPVGAVRLALQYQATIIPGFYRRIHGPRAELFLGPAFTLKQSGNPERDVVDNVQALAHHFEGYIAKFPAEYMWSYKIWKYSQERRILIISDQKPGHVHQSQALAEIAADHFRQKGFAVSIKEVAVSFKNNLAKTMMMASGMFVGHYSCQGCVWCLRSFLTDQAYRDLRNHAPDVVISTGSSLALINYVVARQTMAKSLVIMKPSLVGLRCFDLLAIPRHDRPARRNNIVVIDGTLNRISAASVERAAQQLAETRKLHLSKRGDCLGVLIGGDTKEFALGQTLMQQLIGQIKSVAGVLNADVLITTSRRTSKEVEACIKQELSFDPRVKMLVIARENNSPGVVEGLFGLSKIVVVSPESVSMVSEAVASGKHVVVFTASGLKKRHREFLKQLSQRQAIHYVDVASVAETVARLAGAAIPRPAIHNRAAIEQALQKIL
ncbi:MAG: mitochondrial fission ELM1 family protein [Candidatus Omnitrophica bacterium]|nr:mitochondrial fission ELM1 family protein [Candidatus Omnitrophota bacterium]